MSDASDSVKGKLVDLNAHQNTLANKNGKSKSIPDTAVAPTDGGKQPEKDEKGDAKKDDDKKHAAAPKLPLATRATDIIRFVLNGEKPVVPVFPANELSPLPREFRIVGDRCIIEVINNTAYLRDEDDVSSALLAHLGDCSGDAVCYAGCSAKDCDHMVRKWMSWAREPASMPQVWGYKSEPQLCFNRLTFDPIPSNRETYKRECPDWFEFESRNTDWNLFLAWLAGVFQPGANRKQAFWLSGDSDSGKSQIVAVIQRAMGGQKGAYVAIEGSELAEQKDSFFFENWINKRLVIVNEAKPKFLNDKLFLSLTGDAARTINRKGRRRLDVAMPLMFLFTSNDQPRIEDKGEIKVRIAYSKISAVPKESRIASSVIQERLDAQLPRVLGYAEGLRKDPKVIDTNGTLICREGHLDEAMDSYRSSRGEDEFEDIFQRCFFEDSVGPGITCEEFTRELRNQGLDKPSRTAFRNFLEKEHKTVRLKRVRPSTIEIWVGVGLRKPGEQRT